MKHIQLEFKGYYLEEGISGISTMSGIYCVYTCSHDLKNSKVILDKLIYIGESVNVYDRITNHEKKHTWKTYLRTGQVLCFSYALISDTDRERAEAAMIYHHKPQVNTEYVSNFPYTDTKVNLSGTTSLLDTSFIVP